MPPTGQEVAPAPEVVHVRKEGEEDEADDVGAVEDLRGVAARSRFNVASPVPLEHAIGVLCVAPRHAAVNPRLTS